MPALSMAIAFRFAIMMHAFKASRMHQQDLRCANLMPRHLLASLF